MKLQSGDYLRLNKYPEKDPNAFARVSFIEKGKKVHISNLNQPFLGSISGTYTISQLTTEFKATVIK